MPHQTPNHISQFHLLRAAEQSRPGLGLLPDLGGGGRWFRTGCPLSVQSSFHNYGNHPNYPGPGLSQKRVQSTEVFQYGAVCIHAVNSRAILRGSVHHPERVFVCHVNMSAPPRAYFHKLQKTRRQRLAARPQAEARSISWHGIHSRAESASLHVFFLLPFVTAPINYYPKLLGQQISISLENLNCKLHVLRWPPTSHSHTHRARGEFDSTPSLGTALESTGFHSVQSFILSQTSHHTGHKAQGHNELPHYI